jgi:hypothetical protein
MKLFACLTVLLLTGCATSGRAISYCDITGPVYISKKDQLTDETARQILLHNETWSRVCAK